MRVNALPAGSAADSAGSLRRTSVRETLSAHVALFTSVTTLVCCALPALMVLLGFGLTSVLAFFTAIPGWENIGVYTIWLFVVTGVFLALGFYFAYSRRAPASGEVCEIPAGGGESACSTATRWNRRILWFSLFLYVVAFLMDFWGIDWMRAQGYFNR